MGNCHRIRCNQGEDESREQEDVQINLACMSSVKQVIRSSSGTFPWQRWPTKKRKKKEKVEPLSVLQIFWEETKKQTNLQTFLHRYYK